MRQAIIPPVAPVLATVSLVLRTGDARANRRHLPWSLPLAALRGGSRQCACSDVADTGAPTVTCERCVVQSGGVDRCLVGIDETNSMTARCLSRRRQQWAPGGFSLILGPALDGVGLAPSRREPGKALALQHSRPSIGQQSGSQQSGSKRGVAIRRRGGRGVHAGAAAACGISLGHPSTKTRPPATTDWRPVRHFGP
jgi:hypothetical protein